MAATDPMTNCLAKAVGGTSQRFDALVQGALPNGTDVYATILNYPITVEGQALPEGQSPNVLARVSDYVAPLTSSAFTIRESSLSSRAETELLTKFMASMYAANQVLLNAKLRKCSIDAIAAQLNVSHAIATEEYASVIDKVSGEVSPGNNFTVSQEGIMNDVIIRKMFGGFNGVPANFDFTAALQPGPGQLIDYSVRDAAVQQQERHHLLGECILKAR